jgi:hypothetical protein
LSGQCFEYEHKSLGYQTDETSVSRGMLLIFFSKFPDAEDGLSKKVLEELVHFVIKELSDIIRPSGPGLIVFGVSSRFILVSLRNNRALTILPSYAVTGILSQDACIASFMRSIEICN